MTSSHAEISGRRESPLGDSAGESGDWPAQLQALRAELDLLQVTGEQTRYSLLQLAREGERLQRQIAGLRQRRVPLQRLRRVARALLRRSLLHGRQPPPLDSCAPAEGIRVAFVGDGTSGSWAMRGAQVASTRETWQAYGLGDLRALTRRNHDVVCFVKRFDPQWAAALRAQGKLVVYDLVDAWKQPDDAETRPTLPEIVAFFKAQLEGLPLDGVIFPNQAMRGDLGRYVPNPITIYHHHRIGALPIELRPQPRTVAYEGAGYHLGPWREVIQRVCQRLGLQFAFNPPSLAIADIGFAARGGRFGTLMASRYKSNVKLANFFAAGLPCVVHRDEESYHEIDNGQVRFFTDEEELEAQIRALTPYSVRREIHLSFLKQSKAFRVETIAHAYDAYFRSLLDQKQRNYRDAA